MRSVASSRSSFLAMVTHETGIFRLAVTSTPFRGEPEGAASYYEALGRATVLWGRFELHFSSCLMIILGLPEAVPITEPLPISWKKRAALWRRAFNTLPILAPFKKSALELIDEVMDGIGDRHFLSHAHWGEFVSSDPLTVKACTVAPRKGTANIVEMAWYHIPIDMLRAITTKADDFNSQLLPTSIFLGSLRKPPPGTPILGPQPQDH